MKAVIISDIHGSFYYGQKIQEIMEKENPDKLILLGDLYYHCLPLRRRRYGNCENFRNGEAYHRFVRGAGLPLGRG